MISHKIDSKAVWPRNGHAANVGVKNKDIQIFLILYYADK